MLEIRRREFIAGLGGAAVWPLAAGAQQGDRVRRIGFLAAGDENPVAKSRFTQTFADLGWTKMRSADLRASGSRGAAAMVSRRSHSQRVRTARASRHSGRYPHRPHSPYETRWRVLRDRQVGSRNQPKPLYGLA
jgi:hypothetical protein